MNSHFTRLYSLMFNDIEIHFKVFLEFLDAFVIMYFIFKSMDTKNQ